MAYDAITASDWLAYRSSRQQAYTDYSKSSATKEKKINDACEKSNHTSSTCKRQVRTTSREKRYGGVKKAKDHASHSNLKQLSWYEALFATAMRSSPTQALTLAEIHAFIAASYPCFKTCPSILKANICKTLWSSGCFEKLEERSGLANNSEGSYWTLARKEKTVYSPKNACIIEKPTDMAIEAEKGSERTDSLSERPHSQPKVTTNYRPTSSQSTVTNSQATHDDLLRRYIHYTPSYRRVPVITPTQSSRQEEPGIKIGQVFSLNPQSSMVLPTVIPRCPPVEVPRQEPLWRKIIPYHPCTLWVSHATQNSPTLSSFISEDKERYEDA